MKIHILKDVYDVIQNDINLKTNEKEWRYFYSFYLNNLLSIINKKDEYNNTISYSSSYFHKLFGDAYKEIENWFISNNLIIIDFNENNNKKYRIEEGITSKLYINFPVSDFIIIELKYKNIIKKIEDLFSGTLNKQYYSAKNKKNNIELINNDLLDNYRDMYMNKVSCAIPNSLELSIIEITKSINNCKNTKNIIEYNKQLKKLYNEKNKLLCIMNNKKNISIDDFGNRLHTDYVRVSKDFRKSITLNGNFIKEIDIVNCQPWLLSNLIDDDYFKEICMNGKFYDTFIDITKDYEGERERVKKTMMLIFFGFYQKENNESFSLKERNNNSLLNQFINLFPKVWKFIEETNKDNYKNLCMLLQRMESDLMINNIWVELRLKNIDALTIHDSICVEENNYELTKSIINTIIINKNYTLPKFK